MSDFLDSRAIRRTDCYAQRFMRPGRYSYHILPAHAHQLTRERPFTIIAEDGGGKRGAMKQYNVLIKARAGRFHPDAQTLTIATGDLVLWNCVDQAAPPLAIIGDQDFFASNRLTNECGYSHAFGLPGEYRWTDAWGSGVGGVVRVRDPGCKDDASLARWRDTLEQGTLVMIADGKAKPAEIAIETGQTVFFAVVTGPGISITDERLIAQLGPVGDCAAAA